jgi:hypothetical protein
MGALAKSQKSLAEKFRRVNALSGTQIIDSLIGVADKADQNFNPKMLNLFWETSSSVYHEFLVSIGTELGLTEEQCEGYIDPFGGYNQHHFIKKESASKILSHCNITNSNLLNKINEQEELLLVSYHAWYRPYSSNNYFDLKAASSIERILFKMRGLKEIDLVEKEIVTKLKPYQMNSSDSPLEFLMPNVDLFDYKNRIFLMQQKIGRHLENDGGSISMTWAFGIHSKWPEPIGYVLLNKDLKNRKLLLP